eukprot:3466700-Rhodomonas_salina.1
MPGIPAELSVAGYRPLAARPPGHGTERQYGYNPTWRAREEQKPGLIDTKRRAQHQQTDPPPRSRTFMNDQPG